MRPYKLIAILLVALCAAEGVSVSAGTFVDRDGGSHAWSVDDSHTLIWNGSPYIPFGVFFEPRYLASGQTPENWAADEEDVAAFKLAGVKDICLRPGKGISSIPKEALQKVIDLLESHDLRYGIELYDTPYIPIAGYVVQPAVNRQEGIKTPGEVARSFPGARRVLHILSPARAPEIREINRVATEDGDVSISVTPREAIEHVLLFYPLKVVEEGDQDWSLPDIWSSYDHHRDRLVLTLKGIKFGKGLRFFIDPFSEKMGVRGDVHNLIPISRAFRMEYAAWLSKKYASPRDLGTSWGVLKYDLPSFDEAARLIPLWNGGKGIPAVYDDGTARTHPVDVTRSTIWFDFQEFRAQSVAGYMNLMADAVKRVAADVPMVYTANGLQPMYQVRAAVGYDGIVVPPASQTALVEEAGRVFSLADSASQKSWIVSRIGHESAVFERKDQLFSAINSLRDLGAKGFFAGYTGGNAVNSADLMVWMAEYASLSASDQRFAAFRPRAIYYPDGLSRGEIKRLSGDVWWLPKLIGGVELPLGTRLSGYYFPSLMIGGTDIYIWSLKGDQTVTLVSSAPVMVVRSNGDSADVAPKKDRVQFTVGPDPVILRGANPDLFLPVEVVQEAVEDYEKAIARADLKKLDVTEYKRNLGYAKDMLNKNQLILCYDLVRSKAAEIDLRLRGMETRNREAQPEAAES